MVHDSPSLVRTTTVAEIYSFLCRCFLQASCCWRSCKLVRITVVCLLLLLLTHHFKRIKSIIIIIANVPKKLIITVYIIECNLVQQLLRSSTKAFKGSEKGLLWYKLSSAVYLLFSTTTIYAVQTRYTVSSLQYSIRYNITNTISLIQYH